MELRPRQGKAGRGLVAHACVRENATAETVSKKVSARRSASPRGAPVCWGWG